MHIKNRIFRAVSRLSLVMAINAVLVLPLTGCFLLPKEEGNLPPPLKIPRKETYQTIKVKRETIVRKFVGYGKMQPQSQVTLSFKYRAGNIKSIYVQKGDRVKKGDVLIELYPLSGDDLEKSLKQLEFDLKEAQEKYDQQVVEGKAKIELALIKLNNLKKEYEYAKKNPDTIAPADLEELKANLDLQQLEYNNLLKNYNSEKGNEGLALRQAALNVRDIELRMEKLRDDLESSRLVSPVDGVIGEKVSVREGDYVQINQQLVTVVDNSRLLLKCTGTNSDELEPGMKGIVEFISMDDPRNFRPIRGKEFEGTIVSTPASRAKSGDPEGGTHVSVEVHDLPDTDFMNAFGHITIILQESKNSISLPKTVIHQDGERKFVYVLEGDISAEREVTLGIETSSEVEILEGLEEGDEVLMR